MLILRSALYFFYIFPCACWKAMSLQDHVRLQDAFRNPVEVFFVFSDKTNWSMDLTSKTKGTLVFKERVEILKYEPFPSETKSIAFRKSSGVSTPSPPFLPLPLFPTVFFNMMLPNAARNYLQTTSL